MVKKKRNDSIKQKKPLKEVSTNSKNFKNYHYLLLIFGVVCFSIIAISYMTRLYLDNSVAKNIVEPDKEARSQRMREAE